MGMNTRSIHCGKPVPWPPAEEKSRKKRRRCRKRDAEQGCQLFLESREKGQALGPGIGQIHRRIFRSFDAMDFRVQSDFSSYWSEIEEGNDAATAFEVRNGRGSARNPATRGFRRAESAGTRLLRAAEVLVNRFGGAAALGNRPHHQRLAAAHIAGGKNAGNRVM